MQTVRSFRNGTQGKGAPTPPVLFDESADGGSVKDKSDLALGRPAAYKKPRGMSGSSQGARRVVVQPAAESPETTMAAEPPAPTDPTQELLRACIGGDRDARGRLIEEYTGIVSYGVSVIFQQFGRPSRKEEIEDLCQDVFLSLFDNDARKLRQYQGRNGCSLASWLRVVASRQTIDRLRREGRMISLDDPESSESTRVRETRPDDQPGPEPQMEAAERAAKVREMVKQLPPKDQLFVQLFYFKGLPVEEVAETIGITTNAAYVRKMRLHEKLRKILRTKFRNQI